MNSARRIKADPGRVVSITRRFSTTNAAGVVHQVGEIWALVRLLDDLRFDGWECIRRADVRDIATTSSEIFAERVLLAEHALDRIAVPPLALDTDAGLIQSVASRPIVALELEVDDDFRLGRVIEVAAESVIFQCVDAAGRWDRDARRIMLADITRLQFGDHYGTMFERHADRPSKPEDVVDRITSDP